MTKHQMFLRAQAKMTKALRTAYGIEDLESMVPGGTHGVITFDYNGVLIPVAVRTGSTDEEDLTPKTIRELIRLVIPRDEQNVPMWSSHKYDKGIIHRRDIPSFVREIFSGQLHFSLPKLPVFASFKVEDCI